GRLGEDTRHVLTEHVRSRGQDPQGRHRVSRTGAAARGGRGAGHHRRCCQGARCAGRHRDLREQGRGDGVLRWWLHAALLFADDCDLPPEPAEPEVIEPIYSAAELAEAREAGRHDGHATALAEAAASDTAAMRETIEAIASEFATAHKTAAREA